MRILVTGITGFVGSHLADFLSTLRGAEVHGLARRVRPVDGAHVHACDIESGPAVDRLVRRLKPQRILHLAGQPNIPASWENPAKTFSQNVDGALNLLEAVRRHAPKARIQLTGSAHEYGIPPKAVRSIGESVPMNPMSPYAVSKIAQDRLALLYGRQYGLSIVRTRGFNQIGPRQSRGFIAADFARQVALIEAGKQKPEILVGSLDAVRDFTDVRDMARAYWLALEKGEPGEVYNIATGQGRTGRDMLDFYLKESSAKIRVKTDPSRLRPHELPRLVGDAAKFRRRTGWKPEIRFEDSLRDILNDWRQRIRNE